MELVVRVRLKDGTKASEVQTWLAGLLAQLPPVREATVLTPDEDAQEEKLKKLIHVEGLPDLVETTRLYVRISPELRMQVGKQSYSLMRVFLARGVQRTNTILENLKVDDEEAWAFTSKDGVRAAYSKLAAEMASTPFPLITGRRGVYGFASQAAVTKKGKRSMKRWKPEQEI